MDTRLVQTAVLGSPDSDQPVVCPEDAEELDIFRQEHEGESWWCGTHLPGGCGQRLKLRRYTDRKCHFAHYGGADAEHRCGRGRDSANHLFVKADLAAWLRGQGAAAVFDYPAPVGSAVRAVLGDGRVLLVHLDRGRPVRWDDEGVWEVVLGPGVQAGPDVLAERGQVHRFRLDKKGNGSLAVVAGVQTVEGGTHWFDLAELVLGAAGLYGPDGAAPVSAPRKATAAGGTEAAPRHAVVPGTRTVGPGGGGVRQPELLQALQKLDGALYRENPGQVQTAMHVVESLLGRFGEDADRELRAGLAKGRHWQEQRARRRTTVITQLRENFAAGLAVGGLLSQALELVADADAPEAEKACVADIQARRAARAQVQQEREQARRALERERQARADAESLAAAKAAIQARISPPAVVAESFPEDADIARGLYGALKKTAREGRETTWSDLRQRTGDRRLGQLDGWAKVRILVLVDERTGEDEPLLSVLLAHPESAISMSQHRDVARRLGRPLPELDSDLVSYLAVQRTTLYEVWKHR
ncbi:hypothetical protein ACFV6F_27730 [Kitasatospora phosalacinea]|uniref:hypothetical protein n=1 Tax=Kitasatospora phosalacinea TaxID=2065 RepID=UPI003663666C